MKSIIVIGGGFSGLACIKRLLTYRGKAEITLINDKQDFNFLPLLPDCISGRVNPEYLTFNLANLSRRINFVKERVTGIDLEGKRVVFSGLTFNYDFLLVGSGTETNFYGNEEIRKAAIKLDNTDDVNSFIGVMSQGRVSAYVIAGAGYTGIEVATNLRVALNKQGIKGKIVIVERATSILGPLPQWMKDYVLTNLKNMDIEVLTDLSVDRVYGRRIDLSGGQVFDDAVLIWTAGVETSAFIRNLNVEKSPQGRIRVDEYLRFNDSCFAAGDAAFFSYKDSYLRMAVQFSIVQGDCAGLNIIKSMQGKSLVKYRPVDLGYIIPMANNRSCGILFGFKVKGVFPVFLHYLMCIYRSLGLRNKLGVLLSVASFRLKW
ncbi:MAG: FAD-dependent oxidoreductase [Candidatus Omnitrophica bacterium]|jgi:NADH dehydrogenase|nr:FAD-dependent oxidoreductase [Candidatus Omnitrophota bacterium]